MTAKSLHNNLCPAATIDVWVCLLQGSFGTFGPKEERNCDNEFPGLLGPRDPKVLTGVENKSTSTLEIRRRTNVQQLTCKIDLSNSFYYLFFSFIILELKPLVLKGKVLGEKF